MAMKKIILKAILLAMMIGGASDADAQQYVVTREAEEVNVENPEGEDIVNISSDKSSPGRVRLQVAGVELVMGSEPEPVKKRYNLAKPGHLVQFEFGTPYLTAPNYRGYDDRTFLTLDMRKSYSFGYTLLSSSIALTRNEMLSLSIGFQAVFNEYVFANPITLQGNGERIEPIALTSSEYKKSKLATGGFRLPVILELNMPNDVFLAAGVYGGITGAYTKTKFPKVRETEKLNPYINQLYLGVTVRAGYGPFIFYVNYDMTPMFRKDMGPRVLPMSFGGGFDIFKLVDEFIELYTFD
jgi:hypothetical protein